MERDSLLRVFLISGVLNSVTCIFLSQKDIKIVIYRNATLLLWAVFFLCVERC